MTTTYADSSVDQTLRRAWTLQLQREFQETLQYYRLLLPTPWIELSESRTRYGSFDPMTRTLRISVHLIREHSWDVVLEVLKHEMAHLLQALEGRDDEDPHGPSFQAACQRLGVAPWARHAAIEIDPTTAVQEHRQLNPEQERLLRKVEKLLSLAQSQETHEASLAMERARELCSRHQLEALLEGQRQDYTYILIQHGKKIIPSHQASISSILCTHFYVECVSRSQYDAVRGESLKVLEVLGTRENVQMAEYVYWFLWNQLPLLWEQHKQGARASRTSQRSFYMGVLNGFHEKLSAQKGSFQQKAIEWGLVVHDQQRLQLEQRQQRELKRFVRERYPRLNRGGGSRQGVDYDHYATGQERGRELNLHRGLTRGSSGDIHLLQSGKG